ncbi:putative reverse transcriptase domain-containing protein [Tanacetum coccineum]|uniref:Reverse transcriptase domain-containing protein n=1 Tax=Tanacetum coccineum TaxID=301880 RepID=A0ABQ5J8A3_9ASTR
MPPKKRTTRTSPTTTTTTSVPMTDAQIQELIERGVAVALAKCDADRSRNGDDSHDSGTGRRRHVSTVCECTYIDFLKCQPMNFKGTEGVKFATCTLQGNALTWWNSHVRAVGHDITYAMPWKTLKKMMTDKYCPRSEIKKMETEMWNLKEKGTDVLRIKRSLRALQGTIKTNNNHSKGTMWHGLTLLGLMRRNLTEDLNLYAPNATITMMGSMFPSALTAKGLAIRPVNGHFRSDCSKLRNGNQGNQAGNGNAVARAYDVGTASTTPPF